MHRQAREVLPPLLAALGVDTAANPPWLFGHSDGGSIALLFAAMFPERLRGAIVVAPHIVVEDLSIASIEQARVAYLQGDLRQRLARHHADVDSAFWGWNDVWLSPVFRAWKITEAIRDIGVPLLAAQGLDDEYGTLLQIRGIQARVPQTQLLELADCGHSPQRDQPDALIAASGAFIQQHAHAQQHGDPT
jgi:pimeloyl-ACP methyl ester carboxylesterase